MINKENYYKTIRDAVHGNIIFDKKIFIDLINSVEFQRLHRISQLGGTFMAFPTANHTRFSHSIGTYCVTKKILDNIKNNTLSEYEQTVTLIAALLHDIGHGPFSHAFEYIHNIAHEKYSSAIILGDSEINKILNNYDSKLAIDIAKVIDKKHNNKIMVQLVSSQLDADRLDYLKRDSFFTSVPYSNIDLRWLIQNMEIVNEKIVYNYRALMNIEQYLLGRFNMFNAVYFHKSSNAFEVMISNVFKRVKELYKKEFNFKNNIKLIEPLIKSDKQLSVKEYISLNDYQVLTLIDRLTEEDDLILSQICKMISSRKLLKLVTKEEYDEFVKKCDNNNIDSKYYSYVLLNKVQAYKSHPIPHSESIVIKTKNGELKLIEDISSIVKILATIETKETVYYIYPEVFNIWKK